MSKKEARLRRCTRSRAKMREIGATRLCVHKSSQHIYAQVISPEGSVIASANTLEKTIKGKIKATGNVEAAKLVGQLVAQRALEKGIKAIAFDRSGFSYHGRVKALADAARETGLQF